MLVGAVVAVTVASGRTAWAQTPCLTNTDCPDDGVFCNGTESCDTNISECVHSGDPCVNGAECNNGPCNENTQCATPAVTTCTDDGNACTADQCDGQGACAHPAAVTCDNSQFCNGIATCNPTDGTCVPGTQPTCDDGVVCTADSCDPTANNNTGACVNAPIQGCCTSDADCDDGDACNGVETCDVANQTCQAGTPVVCNDGDVCTTDTCDHATGLCSFPPVAGCCNVDADCDDQDLCTTDACDTVQHVCNHTPAVTCDDGLFCNGLETCNPQDGTCVLGTPPTCDDGMVCTADSCDPTANNNTGGCVNAPIAGCCTTDADCDDHDVCTGTETCEVATGMCHPGTAMVCDDGNPCNGVETCDPAAGCQNGTQLDCNDNLVCTNDLCDPAIGCVNAPIPNCCVSNGDCDDGDICNGLETCVNNTCVAGTPPDCDDHNPCTDDTCDAVMACVHTDNTNPCDDGNPCTVNDTCSGGQCQGGPAGNLGTECRAAAGDCDVAEACDGTNAACPADATKQSGTACTDDGNPCTTDTCDGTSNTCQHAAGNAGTECRAAAGVCDVAEACDGTNTACPADAFQPSTTVCRAGAGACDVAESCTGSSADCPADAFQDQGTVCRAAVDACDIAELCTGSGAACPADAVKTGSDGVTCAFGNTVSPSVCQTESVPPGIQKKFTAAGDLASRALEATGRAHRRLVKKAIAKLRQAIKLADKAEGRLKNPISSNCASPIRDVLTDALDRLLTLS